MAHLSRLPAAVIDNGTGYDTQTLIKQNKYFINFLKFLAIQKWVMQAIQNHNLSYLVVSIKIN